MTVRGPSVRWMLAVFMLPRRIVVFGLDPRRPASPAALPRPTDRSEVAVAAPFSGTSLPAPGGADVAAPPHDREHRLVHGSSVGRLRMRLPVAA